jgi:hypothetical protein
MKFPLAEDEVIQADRVTDGQTDNMKVIGAFHKYVYVPKIVNDYGMDVIMIHNLYPEYFCMFDI